MTARQVVPFPKNLARPGFQARRTGASEVDINPARLDEGRRRGVTIHRGTVAERLRVVGVKHLFVKPHFAGFGVHTDGKTIVAVFRRGGQPHLAAHHHRSGPAAMWNRRFPFDVVRLAPVYGQPDETGIAWRCDVAVSARPAELRPVRSYRPREGNQNQQQDEAFQRTLLVAHGGRVTRLLGQVNGAGLGREMRVTPAFPLPKTPRRKRHRIYAHNRVVKEAPDDEIVPGYN